MSPKKKKSKSTRTKAKSPTAKLAKKATRNKQAQRPKKQVKKR